ncbi:MAG: hypothetical protein HY532_08915 [Chloroflexi bacterium]|nr:hypothetical protein [Chloroflexota bacterium]
MENLEALTITDQVRAHLAQGKSVWETIALGYARSTVYAAQRRLRAKRKGRGVSPAQMDGAGAPGATAVSREKLAQGREFEALQGMCDLLEERVAVAEAERDTLREAERSWRAERVALMEQVGSLSVQAGLVEEVRRRVEALAWQRDQARREAARWREVANDEHQARREGRPLGLLDSLSWQG